MKILFCLILCFFLSACANGPTVVTKNEFIVVSPPISMFANCRRVSSSDFPDPQSMTNRDLANLITVLVKRVNTCAISVSNIKEYVENAKKVYENRDE